MTRMFVRLVLLMLCLAAWPQAAAAQSIDSPYRFLDNRQYVGLLVGHISADEGRIGNGPHPGAYIGATWGYRVSGPFTVTADIAYFPTQRTVRDTVFTVADSTYQSVGDADIDVLTLMAGLRFDLTGARTWHNLQPYLLLGAGLALDLAGGSAIEAALPTDGRYDFGTSFAGQAGAGVNWFPTSRVSLRIDARNMLWKGRIPEAFQLTSSGVDLPSSDWEQNIAFTVGLSFHF